MDLSALLLIIGETASRARLSEALCATVAEAGLEILAVYAEEIVVQPKADRSPVTEADGRAERRILERLAAHAPGVPVVAEESVSAGVVPEIGEGPFFLVDPLDGTREFISRNGEFTVNIALIEDAHPVLGAVHLPALGETYWADGSGRAWRRRAGSPPEPIACREPPEALVAVASRSHRDARTDEFLARFPVGGLISAGSSLKLCRVAEGAADMYPRIGRTMEWDIAAGHAVLAAAGGMLTTLEGAPLGYAKPGFENPPFEAWGFDPRRRALLVDSRP